MKKCPFSEGSIVPKIIDCYVCNHNDARNQKIRTEVLFHFFKVKSTFLTGVGQIVYVIFISFQVGVGHRNVWNDDRQIAVLQPKYRHHVWQYPGGGRQISTQCNNFGRSQRFVAWPSRYGLNIKQIGLQWFDMCCVFTLIRKIFNF